MKHGADIFIKDAVLSLIMIDYAKYARIIARERAMRREHDRNYPASGQAMYGTPADTYV